MVRCVAACPAVTPGLSRAALGAPPPNQTNAPPPKETKAPPPNAKAPPPKETKEQEPILVGLAGPMSGPFAFIGEQMKRGAQQAVDDINGKSGVLGRKLKL